MKYTTVLATLGLLWVSATAIPVNPAGVAVCEEAFDPDIPGMGNWVKRGEEGFDADRAAAPGGLRWNKRDGAALDEKRSESSFEGAACWTKKRGEDGFDPDARLGQC